MTAAAPASRVLARTPSAGAAAALVGAGAIALAFALERALTLGAPFVGTAAVAAVLGGAAVALLAARHVPRGGFGAANAVTLVRGGLVSVYLALLAAEPRAALAWLAMALAVAGVALDGVDGRVARRRGEVSAFGARLDMETDALSILVLAALVWHFGKAGAWVLLAGLMRYAFVAASYAWSWLGRPLPPSRRRQAVCVVQIVSLIAALAPLVPAPVAAAVALAGLAALVASFGADVAWLARRSAA